MTSLWRNYRNSLSFYWSRWNTPRKEWSLYDTVNRAVLNQNTVSYLSVLQRAFGSLKLLSKMYHWKGQSSRKVFKSKGTNQIRCFAVLKTVSCLCFCLKEPVTALSFFYILLKSFCFPMERNWLDRPGSWLINHERRALTDSDLDTNWNYRNFTMLVLYSCK